MSDKLFVIAIGGTGMRCLESFVHLCAIGMFDGKEIHALTLDTDCTNGNKGRVEELIDLYNSVKKDGSQDGKANVDTFFSAKINLYKFYTDYADQTRSNFSLLSANHATLPNSDEIRQDNKDLSDLFLDDNVQSFNLEHGYRAQTHLGSLLMYHGIVEAMKTVVNDKDKALPHQKALSEFVNNLTAVQDARVFVFGSVFGGTGASSIPIIPKALRDAAALDNTNTIDLNKVKFASTLLTQYFSFNAPDKKQKEVEKVIASADTFAINSQAALQFYQSDPTVRKFYKRFYHIGWPDDKKMIIAKDGNTITGGNDQKNDSHIVELMCACAAYDFFKLPEAELNNDEAVYLYKSVEEKNGAFKFTGNTFIEGSDGDLLTNKLGIFLSFAHIVLTLNGAATKDNNGTKAFIDHLSRQKINDYKDLTDAQTKDIDDYLKKFAYDINSKNRSLISGWIYQLYKSIGAGSFIFKNEAFEEDPKRLEKIDPGKLFSDDKYNWKHGLFSNSYDYLAKLMAEDNCKPNDNVQQLHSIKEKFLAHIYKCIAKAQNFE